MRVITIKRNVSKEKRARTARGRFARDFFASENHFEFAVEALKPVLAELVKNGRRAGPARPWLGVAAEEVQGRLIVARVSPEGPADRAGVQSGDIILAVGGEGVRSQAEFYLKVWGRGAAGSEIPLRILQGIELRDISVRSMDRVDYFRKKPNL